ncbi:MAG: hypothetical protein Q4D60_07030 [Eubacteriales bacterium]|nr:hypothetical protein [Eubacteriales bacterium]
MRRRRRALAPNQLSNPKKKGGQETAGPLCPKVFFHGETAFIYDAVYLGGGAKPAEGNDKAKGGNPDNGGEAAEKGESFNSCRNFQITKKKSGDPVVKQWLLQNHAGENRKEHHIYADHKDDFKRGQPDFTDVWGCLFFCCQKNPGAGARLPVIFPAEKLRPEKKEEWNIQGDEEAKPCPVIKGEERANVPGKEHGTDEGAKGEQPLPILFGQKPLFVKMADEDGTHGEPGAKAEAQYRERRRQQAVSGQEAEGDAVDGLGKAKINPEFRQ